MINESEDISVTALFYWDKKAEARFDQGFGQAVTWDVPLLSGYQYYYLSDLAKSISVFKKLWALWQSIDRKKYYIVWTHGYTDIYTFCAIIFAKLKGLRVFVRGESLHFPGQKKGSAKNILRKIFFAGLNCVVDRFLAVGTPNKNFYLSYNIAPEKIVLCQYTVDNDFFYQKYCESAKKIGEIKASLQLAVDRPIILYASKFITRKYPIDLLHAFRKLNVSIKPYLLFIGTGETLNAVKAEAQSDQDSVRFLGFKNQSELPDYYAIADVLVLPSERETWGLIVNEAMNAECAIVVSDQVGCAIDLVKSGVNGFIFPARDVAALSECLRKIITDSALCDSMKKNSRKIISHWGLPETVNGLRTACAE